MLLIEGQARLKDIAIIADIDADVPLYVLTDSVRLSQVISNLLSNAVKFTAAGSVTLRIGRTPADQLRFEVADTGIGIPADRLDRLFARFVQADRSTTRTHGGTGLGLSICKGLVELMGGRIGVVSAAGAGSTFWFEIPLVEVAALSGGLPTAFAA